MLKFLPDQVLKCRKKISNLLNSNNDGIKKAWKQQEGVEHAEELLLQLPVKLILKCQKMFLKDSA